MWARHPDAPFSRCRASQRAELAVLDHAIVNMQALEGMLGEADEAAIRLLSMLTA